MIGSRRVWAGAALLVLGAVLLGSIAYLLVLALGGAELLKVALPSTGSALAIHDARPWLIAAAIAGGLSLAAWALAERRLIALDRLVESERAARDAEKEARRQLRVSESQRSRLERERNEERAQLTQLARGWRSERDWNHELRDQISRMQRTHGLLGNHDDTRKMGAGADDEPRRRREGDPALRAGGI